MLLAAAIAPFFVSDAIEKSLLVALFSVLAALFSLVVERRGTGEGILRALRRSLRIAPPQEGGSYREAADRTGVVIDGERVPAAEVREVVLGHFSRIATHKTIDHWPVYVVLSDRVVEVAVHRRRNESVLMGQKIADELGVPCRRMKTGDFLRPVDNSALAFWGSIAQLAAIPALLVLIFELSPRFVVAVSLSLIPLVLFVINEIIEDVMAKRTRGATDALVAEAFGPGPSHVRVEDPRDEVAEVDREDDHEDEAEQETIVREAQKG